MYVMDAAVNHANELARLICDAGEHLPYYLWQLESGDTKSVLDAGTRIISKNKEATDYSYQNARVCMENEQLLGAIFSFQLPNDVSLEKLHEHPEPLIPILMLETKVPGTWFIHTISVAKQQRNRGIGKLLMRDAELLAHENGFKEMAIIVNSSNKPALSMYSSLGFTSKDQLPIVPYPTSIHNSYWILLTAPVNGPMVPTSQVDSGTVRNKLSSLA